MVGLDVNPPQAAMVLCVDETTQVQALDRTTPVLALLPGTPQRATHDAPRQGTTNLDAALEVAAGKVISQLPARHRAVECKRFAGPRCRPGPRRAGRARELRHLLHPQAPGHPAGRVRQPRFHVPFTPTSSSWLHLVERWFAELTTRRRRRGTHRSVQALTRSLHAWIDTWNQDPRPLVWTKTADELLDTIAAYGQRINHSGH